MVQHFQLPACFIQQKEKVQNYMGWMSCCNQERSYLITWYAWISLLTHSTWSTLEKKAHLTYIVSVRERDPTMFGYITTGPMVPLVPFFPTNPTSPCSPTGPVSPKSPCWPLLPWRTAKNTQDWSQTYSLANPNWYWRSFWWAVSCMRSSILFTFDLLRNQTPMDGFSPEKVKWLTFGPGIPLSPILPGMPSRP